MHGITPPPPSSGLGLYENCFFFLFSMYPSDLDKGADYYLSFVNCWFCIHVGIDRSLYCGVFEYWPSPFSQ